MPIPVGARQVPGMPNRVILPSGETVTRYRARRMGARELGYSSERAYTRKISSGDNTYFRKWADTPNGRDIIAKEKAIAARENRPYSESDIKRRLIAARNARPHGDRYRQGQPGRPAGSAFQDFMDRYDIDDERDIYY
jgi:hypothetical protein